MTDKTKGTESELASNNVVVHKIEGTPVSGAVGSDAMKSEDGFFNLYVTPDNPEGTVIRPPYDLNRLMKFRQENSTLGQCIAAMEVNIDGTGYDIERRDEAPMEDADKEKAYPMKDFFDEPWPGMSMTTLRREVRRDLETVGNGYIEVLTNAKDEIIFMRWLEGHTMRLCRLGEPVPVKRTLQRNGKKVEITVDYRERAFAQQVGSRTVYFKEFGATRDIDKDTGKWSAQNKRLPAHRRGSQILHLTVQKDADTPYGIPRWINQLPSVVGSRKAEEFNLDFFTNGGIPPAIVFLSGGQASPDSIQTLTNLLSGKTTTRAAVVEVQSTSGSLDSAGKVETKVERFGAEQKNDSMFESYNEKNENRIRGSFRISPLFTGQTQDFTYATAVVAYMIAENQVFRPERDEFDEAINVSIMRALQDGDDTYWFRSRPMSVSDVDNQMKGLELSKDVVTQENWVAAMNDVTGMNMKFDQKEYDDEQNKKRDAEAESARQAAENANANKDPEDEGEEEEEGGEEGGIKVEKSDNPHHILQMVDNWVSAMRKENDTALEKYTADVAGLSKSDRALFNSMLASKTLFHTELDFEGSAELSGCASELCGGIGGHA